MYDIIAISIPIVLAVCTVLGIRAFADASLRKRLAETQTDADVIRALLETGRRQRERNAGVWGIMLALVGLALAMVGLFNISADDPLAYGLVFIATGAGLLAPMVLDRIMR